MITYDPGVISRRQLFDVFFCIHDSTQLNRQGNDVGPQYRSIILYSDQEQRVEALAVIEDYSDHYTDPIVTEDVPRATRLLKTTEGCQGNPLVGPGGPR